MRNIPTKAIVFSIISWFLCISSIYGQIAIGIDFTNEIDKEVKELMDEGKIPGLVLVILKDNKEIIKNYGYTSKADKEPISSETLFELGSCSKAFTSLAITKLIHENKLSYTTKASDIIPWLELKYDQKPVDITVDQLLRHTSGIPWNSISKIPPTNADDALTLTVQQIKEEELTNYPGTSFEYATINYDILALIIETITSQSFESYVQEQLLNPLQLKHTSVGKPIQHLPKAVGHKISFFKPRIYTPPIFKGNNAAGYFISNGLDMAKWLKFQMGLIDSDLYPLAKETHQRDKSVPIHGMSSYARGWIALLDGTGTIFHDGLNPTFTSYVAFRPKDKIGIAILANSNSNFTNHIGGNVMKILNDIPLENEIDPDDGIDKVFSTVVIGFIVYLFIALLFLGLVIKEIYTSEREKENLSTSKLARLFQMFVALCPFIYGLYILPEAGFKFNWSSILVWAPTSLPVMVIIILVAIGLTYLIFALTIYFPEKNKFKRAVPKILLMSIVTGISDIGIIMIITSSFNSSMEFKYKLFYYLITLFVYLVGRRMVQIGLINFSYGLVYDFRMKMITKIFSSPFQNFEKIDPGRVYTTLNNDLDTLAQSSGLFVGVLVSSITTIGAFIFLASLSFWATIVTLIVIFSLMGIGILIAKITRPYYEKARDAQNEFMDLAHGMVNGFKEISLHRKKKIEYRKDIAISVEKFKTTSSLAGIKSVDGGITGEVMLVLILGGAALGIPELYPNIKVYTVISFVMIILFLIGPVKILLGSVSNLNGILIALNRVRTFLKEIPSSIDLDDTPPAKISQIESFKVSNVKFHYTNAEGKKSFSVGPLNLEAKKGDVIFIIGGNGSGKTTVGKLLTGLYEPNKGFFYINGQPIQSNELGEYFSTVFTPTYLFNKLYNIDVEKKEKDIKHFLKLLHLNEKVVIEGNTYSTTKLSGGQRKRLALLQCYMEDSPIYLFDEWAADQDPSYRKFFYRTLLPEMKRLGKIVIAITHDDHYFDAADKILEMNYGKLEICSPNKFLGKLEV